MIDPAEGAPATAKLPVRAARPRTTTSSPVRRMALALSLTALACNSEVTVEPTAPGGNGGAGSSGGAGGTTSTGISGGATASGGGGGTGEAGGGATGGSGGSGGAGGAPSCPTFNACTECLSAGCSDAYCACANEIHCFGYLECLGTCQMSNDPTCPQGCAAVHQPGISAAFLVADCAATECDGTCMFGKALNDCQTCLYTSCPDPMNACIADPECLALIQCFQTCSGDMPCNQSCLADHPDGIPGAQAIKTCQTDSCFDACL